ncbi:MAG: hypothetical protein HY581_04340 [Nitrospirae bacterium]|nr:hypothetical protein [Nitrospirota bacterium]
MPRKRFLPVLSATVLGTLFLCQVLGSLCLMVPPIVGTATTIHGAHMSHTMGEGRMCQDSVPSSSKSFETPALHPLPLLESFCPDITQTGLSAEAFAGAFPAASDPPLYTRLSTFRI